MNNILEMRNITKTFPGVRALSNVSLEVKRGEIHAICGENGAGKSTLMKVLSGVYPHGTYEGDIFYENEVQAFKNIRESEAKGIVIIHQELALSPYLSIAENIFLNNEITKRGLIDWNRTNQEAQKLMAKVGLREKPDTKVMEIGVGKQQLVEIAKALSKQVRLLILDEPTAALNDEDSAHLLDLLRQLRSQGISCIIISHKLNEIASIADKTTIIRDGKTIETLDMSGGKVDQERIIKGMVGKPAAIAVLIGSKSSKILASLLMVVDSPPGRMSPSIDASSASVLTSMARAPAASTAARCSRTSP